MEPLPSHVFPATSKADWLAQVRKELKDEFADNSLRWTIDPVNPDNGLTVDAYYTADDLTGLPLTTIQEAQHQTNRVGWLNAPEYQITDPAGQSATLRDALTRGADALVLSLPEDVSQTDGNLARLLHGIKLSDTPVYFRLSGSPVPFLNSLRPMAPYQLKGGLLTTVSVEEIVEVTRLTTDSPQFRTISIGSHDFHNAGASAVQELAFTLARLADQYRALLAAGLPLDQLAARTMLSVSVGTSYFVEIAKLRALRVLWHRQMATYADTGFPGPLLLAQTSTFYDAAVTPYTNLLRATTEAMAAVIGGCNVLTVHPYDTVLKAPGEFSERIARNVSILLKEESYLDRVADPAAGSYYIETLTHQLAGQAWSLFGQVQAMGGFQTAMENGFVQAEIDRTYQARVEAVRGGKVLVGVTKFRFDDDTTAEAAAPPAGLTRSTSLPDRRLAAEFEQPYQ